MEKYGYSKLWRNYYQQQKKKNNKKKGFVDRFRV
jgi:hypothetical protein